MRQGLQEYYELFRRIAWYDRDPVQKMGNGRLATKLVGNCYLEDKGAALLNRLAPAWLDEWAEDGKQRPFFMFINYLEPHLPYNPPEPYRFRFVHGGVREKLEFLLEPNWWLRDKTFELLQKSDQLEPDDFAQLGELYDGGLAYQDRRLEALVSDLEARGLEDETILIVTSDHGENLGEHDGLVAHNFSVHQSVLHVPLLIRFPRAIPAGERYQGLVSTASLYSTVLELVGVSWDNGVDAIEPPLPLGGEERGRRVGVSEEELRVDERGRIGGDLAAAAGGRVGGRIRQPGGAAAAHPGVVVADQHKVVRLDGQVQVVP